MTIAVLGTDGRKYTVRVAVIITGITDSGMTNPLDDMPIYQINTHSAVETKLMTAGAVTSQGAGDSGN